MQLHALSAPTDVVFALAGDVRNNSRAIKQLRLVRSLGLTATVFALGEDSGAPFLDEGVHLRLLPRPPGGGPRFFWRVHSLFLDAARAVRARVYHASDLYCLHALRLAAAQHKARLVYDARELYPHVASTARRPWTRAYWHLAERLDIGAADAVFTVSDSIANRLQQTYRIARPEVLHNVPPMQHPEASGLLRERAGAAKDTVLVLHQGSIQKDRGCFKLAKAMRTIHGAVLVFMGGGPLKPALARTVRELGLDQCVRMVDPVPPDMLLPVTADADLGVTLLEDTCLNHQFALPNKLFEYLMAGVPVLASDLHEIGAIVRRFDVGRLVHLNRPGALAVAIQQCVDDQDARQRWRARTPRVFEAYSWTTAAARFTEAYRQLLP